MTWPSLDSDLDKYKSVVRRHPVVAYFASTFAISWAAALAVAAPHLTSHKPLPQTTGILMFPAMLLGPSFSGLFLTGLIDGRKGLRELFSRMVQWRLPARWYLPLLIPPILIPTVLVLLEACVSPVYAPNRFLIGLLFGLPAGFFEEMGWTGYAFEKMRFQNNTLAAGSLLGLLWAIWHLPVIDYLGTATPHGTYWLPFFIVFAVAMTAIRVLICWMFNNTNSVLLAQLMHVSSTGSLVIFSAPRVHAAQEVLWYGIYGFALWVTVTIVLVTFRTNMASCRS